jgi:hypothetical protein
MNANDINQTYDLLTLAQGDTKLKRSGAYYIGACPFCGGRDRFNLKHTPEGWRWFCRKCGDGKYHGTIDYIMRRENLDFKQALESLGGDAIRPRAIVTPQPPAITLPDPAWQESHWQEVNKTSHALIHSTEAEKAREYLQSRGLNRATWEVNLLGFGYVFKRPAIIIPWCDIGGNEIITAIKYRFIDEQARDPNKRFMMARGSVPILFGLHAAAGHDILILTEGEINAMSITQTSALELLHVDALSFGSETGNRENILQRVAHDYRRVIVWADKADVSNAIRSALRRPADALCSPVLDGVKYDANALLQKAWLADFLRETLQEPQNA